mgnify:CR=1 FL=1
MTQWVPYQYGTFSHLARSAITVVIPTTCALRHKFPIAVPSSRARWNVVAVGLGLTWVGGCAKSDGDRPEPTRSCTTGVSGISAGPSRRDCSESITPQTPLFETRRGAVRRKPCKGWVWGSDGHGILCCSVANRRSFGFRRVHRPDQGRPPHLLRS